MAAILEGRHTAEFMVSEANPHRARDEIVLAEDEVVEAGQVLGKIDDDSTAADPELEGQYRAWTAGASDGTETAVAIAWTSEDATGAAKRMTAVTRDAEVVGAHLVWPTGTSDGQKATAIAQLAAVGIIVR